MSFRSSFVPLAMLALAGACGGATNEVGPSTSGVIDLDGGSTATDGPRGLPCDVDALLTQHCRKCHAATPLYGAPMPLMTWENFHARAVSNESKNIYELVPLKIADDKDPMPPPPNARLSAAERKVLGDWAAAGAPRGPDTCGGDTKPSPTPTPTVSCTPNRSLAPKSPWIMPTDAGDEYVCWGVDLTEPTPTHITAFAPRIDNTKIVHHVVMYEAPSSYSGTPTVCSAASSLQWRMVLGWAPGSKGLEMPPEAGFPIATTGATHYVVQMHYSNPQKLVGEKDSSGVDLCTAPPRKYEADVLAFGTQSIKIPAQPPPGGVFKRECSITVAQQFAGLHLFAAMPHMHKLGVSMTTSLAPKAGGAAVDLGSTPSFNFNNQSWFPLNATTAAGDVITTTCGWTNTTGAEVRFGENTADEMCYSFTMYYPRIKAAVWSWAAPALPPPIGATCK